MTQGESPPTFELKVVREVAVVEIQARELRHPPEAMQFGEDLALALEAGGHKRVLIDFTKNDYLCSTAFAVVLNLAKDLQESGGMLKLCCLHPDVLRGANIIGLGRVVEIYDDERDALKSF